MDDEKYATMIEATRLTREGRLNEATQLIQRTLGLGHNHPGAPSDVTDRQGIEQPLRLTAPPIVSPEGTGTDVRTAGQSEKNGPTVADKPSEAVTVNRRPTIRRPAVRFPGGLPSSGVTGTHLRRKPVPQSAPAGGQWTARTYTNAAGPHAYKLYIPSKYHGQPMPLIVMLHGCTQDPDDFAAGTRMNFLAEDIGFLAAYPAQAAHANASKCWNWFQPAHQERDTGEPSFIAGVTRAVVAEYKADPYRIYVAGLSAGGAMAAIMAVTHPNLYAAVGVHSGLAAGCAHDLPSAFAAMQHGGHAGAKSAARTVPLILFHGDRDTTVHPNNADHLVRQWTGAKADAEGRGTAPVTVREGRAAGGRAYTCEIHHDARGQVIVERWTIHGAGHSWSGGSPNGSYTDPSGPDASDEMVRFFLEHSRETTAPPAAG